METIVMVHADSSNNKFHKRNTLHSFKSLHKATAMLMASEAWPTFHEGSMVFNGGDISKSSNRSDEVSKADVSQRSNDSYEKSKVDISQRLNGCEEESKDDFCQMSKGNLSDINVRLVGDTIVRSKSNISVKSSSDVSERSYADISDVSNSDTNGKSKGDLSERPVTLKDGASKESNGDNSRESANDITEEMPKIINRESFLKLHLMETLISSIFSTISSLKNAIIHLHSVHIPYDSEKSRLADDTVIAELNKLTRLKQMYRTQMASISSSHGMKEGKKEELTRSKVSMKSSYDRIMESFRSEIQVKDTVIQELKDMLGRSTRKREKLEKKVKKLEQRLLSPRDSNLRISEDTASLASGPSPWLLESAVLGASEASKNFAKVLISLMKMARWNLESAANSIEPKIDYVRRTHKKFVFESYISRRMLSNFEREDLGLYDDDEHKDGDNKSCYKSQKVCLKEFEECRVSDPLELVKAKPDSDFGKYCLKRFLELVHPKMEESFFGNLEHREQVCNGIHPCTQFYRSFMELARSMWMLHKLAFSFHPVRAQIFEVQKYMEFAPLYMESIVQMLDIGIMGSNPKVGFTVMPGFRVQNTIIKCQVYLMAHLTDDVNKP